LILICRRIEKINVVPLSIFPPLCLASLVSQRRNISTPPVLLNACIVVAQIIAVAACFFAASRITTWSALIALALGFALLMNSVYSIIHEAEHTMLFENRAANDLTGAFMSLFFPAPFHLIRQGHLGHHLRNRSDDEAFDLYFEDDHWWWRFAAFYGILTGFYWLIVVLSNIVFLFWPYARSKTFWEVDRPAAAFMQSLNPRYTLWIRLECLAAIALHSALIYFLQIPLLNYAIIYAAFGFSWSAMQYVHHYGTERHVTRGARNLWLCAPIDLLWLNHNWHLTHHENPTVPWVHLPKLSQSEAGPRGFLPFAYVNMWRGPRRATDRVQNKYAGRIIA
jgi:fatty acid desaturase